MKFKRHIEIEHGLRQFDIAPLIDIIFQLLIFFMLTSSFIAMPAISVNLPKASSSDIIKKQNFVITISAENVLYLDEEVITIDELKQRLKRVSQDKIPVLILSDKTVSIGRVVEVWDICRELGISKINIATMHR